jgi:hypothetical protein
MLYPSFLCMETFAGNEEKQLKSLQFQNNTVN